jgi:hypothetical protein
VLVSFPERGGKLEIDVIVMVLTSKWNVQEKPRAQVSILDLCVKYSLNEYKFQVFRSKSHQDTVDDRVAFAKILMSH